MEASPGWSTCLNRTRVCSAIGLGLLDATVRGRLRASRGLALGERPLREDLGAGAKLLDRCASVIRAQRPVVALADRGHRRDVARAQALEARDVDLPVRGVGAAVVRLVRVGARGLAEGVQQLVA